MAIPATMVWEVRTTGTAGNANGGGFDSASGGTDYSQQDAAQYGATDLAGTNANTATPTVTSASHSFVAADVGNIIYISAGTSWTVGRYNIVSTSAGTATLDRACASVAVPTSGTYAVGGALSLRSSTDTAVFNSAVVASNIMYVKSGTYAINATSVWNAFLAGSGLKPTQMIGYTATRGDTCNGANRPVFSFAGGSAVTMASNWNLKNLSFILTATGMTAGAQNTYYNCKFYNNTGATFSGAQSNVTWWHCEAISTKSLAMILGSNNLVYGCYIHSSSSGVSMAGPSALINCIISGCYTTSVGISNISCTVIGNTIYGSESKLGTGISDSNGSLHNIYNNIIYGCTTGINCTNAGHSALEDYNLLFNNTTNRVNQPTGPNSLALDPKFINMTQYTGATATLSNFVLTQAGANFANVVDNRDYCYISSGTGATVGYYKITAHTTTTLTFEVTVGTSAVADKVFQVTVGKNYMTNGTTIKSVGFPNTFQGTADNSLTANSYVDIGAVQITGGTTSTTFVGG